MRRTDYQPPIVYFGGKSAVARNKAEADRVAKEEAERAAKFEPYID